jgi:uncharacterized membrane protein
MFEWLFKYPWTAFSKGDFLLAGSWPAWLLGLCVLAAFLGLGWLIRSRTSKADPRLRGWRAAVIWLLQSCLAALLLLLLWQPAISVAQLKPQQNVIAVLVDDSRSMAISENGVTREAQAVKALQDGVLSGLQKKFQTRLYSFDSHISPISNLQQLRPTAPATRMGASLRQLVDQTSDLPVGAIVLLTDGADNDAGIDRATIAELRSRRIPVQTVGFGATETKDDIELDDVSLPARAMANSRMAATFILHQRGFAGRKTTISVRDGSQLLASRQITLDGDGRIQSETLFFNAGDAGVKPLQFSIEPLAGETNKANNAVSRVVDVESGKRQILYIDGEPQWEYKFIREAEEKDPLIQLVSMLRTTENTIYRQGISSPDELAQGFPTTAQQLFRFQGLIIGSVEAAYFTPAQQDLIRQFVNRRGGGVLFLGGRFALGDGGWAGSSMADLLPVVLPNHNHTFHREPATAELTPQGTNSLICRLVDNRQQNADLWAKLPYLMDYQEVGTPKPGAVVLADLKAGGRAMPLLITENYGLGRTAVLATSGTWRWQMLLPAGNPTHTVFWQQFLRWLVANTPGQVVASLPNRNLYDNGHVTFTAQVRDKQYLPSPDATVEARIFGPNGSSAMVPMTPVPNTPGTFQADWTADRPGSYLADVIAERGAQQIGQDVLTFQRLNGVAESFHTAQNRALLERLAQETGGAYWQPQNLSRLPTDIPYSEAGISVRQMDPLWNMPAVFLVILLLLFSEWILRRKWGVV